VPSTSQVRNHWRRKAALGTTQPPPQPRRESRPQRLPSAPQLLHGSQAELVHPQCCPDATAPDGLRRGGLSEAGQNKPPPAAAGTPLLTRPLGVPAGWRLQQPRGMPRGGTESCRAVPARHAAAGRRAPKAAQRDLAKLPCTPAPLPCAHTLTLNELRFPSHIFKRGTVVPESSPDYRSSINTGHP